jgi:hypothetical protein
VLDGRLSPIVEVEKGRGVVLRATDHKLPRQKPLDAVRAQVQSAWKKQRGVELAKLAAEGEAKRLDNGESWDEAAKSLGLPAAQAHFVGRSDPAVPAELRRVAFDAAKPITRPVYQVVSLADGDCAVIAIRAVREDPSGDPKQQDLGLRRQYAQQIAASESESYALAARADAKVAVNPQAVD